jgi:hypothetical protein
VGDELVGIFVAVLEIGSDGDYFLLDEVVDSAEDEFLFGG